MDERATSGAHSATGEVPDLPDRYGDRFRSGEQYAAIAHAMVDLYDPSGDHGVAGSDLLPPRPPDPVPFEEFTALTFDTDTSTACYVWLPFRFDGEMAYLDWRDEWTIEEFE